MEKNNVPRKRGRGGRPTKTDTASNCVMVRFTDEEYARFLSLLEESGVQVKATFIKARVFGERFRVIKTDEGTLRYVAKLSQFHSQFRAVGDKLQPGREGITHPFFTEESAGPALQIGKDNSRTGGNRRAGHCAFRRI